ncbi:hypothetical protein [Rhizobium rhizogenes]|nr:hypothetical protein [Rhizobium rhizogenes]
MDELILSSAAIAKVTGENNVTTFHEPEKPALNATPLFFSPQPS